MHTGFGGGGEAVPRRSSGDGRLGRLPAWGHPMRTRGVRRALPPVHYEPGALPSAQAARLSRDEQEEAGTRTEPAR